MTGVNFIPAHPCEGWISMNRYWEEVAQLASDHSTAYRFSSVLEHPGLYGKASKRLVRAWIKRVVYPAQVKMSARGGIAHVLDHSYAHMLAYVPRRTAKVVTLHDLIPLRESEGLSPASLAGFWKRVGFLREADMIVAVSAHSKREAVVSERFCPCGTTRRWRTCSRIR